MKTKHLLFTSLLMTVFILTCSSKAWAASRYYKCAITSDVTVTLTGVTENKFTVTFSQKGKNTAEYSSKPTGGIYSTSVQLVLESNDRTLEGTYSSKNDAGDNKINCTASASSSYVLNGSTKRYIRTGASAPTSTFTIEKDGSGNYYIGEGTLCVYQSSDYYTYYYNYVEDDLLIEGIDPVSQTFDYTPLSDCDAPTGLTNTSISGTSASFTWTSSESAWQYVCLPSATTLTDALWNSNKFSVNTKSATVTGLSLATDYTFYVLSNCGGDGTSTIVSTDFTVLCSAISTLPWSEGFESATSEQTPGCWRQVLSNANGWFRAISGSSYKHSGSKAARLYGGKNGNSVVTAVFPEFEDDIKTLALSFWYKTGVSDGDYTYGQPQLGYITNPNDASTFVTIGDALDQSSSYVQVENFTVPSNTPNGAYFAIRYAGGLDNEYVCIDDITVTEKPACNKPTGVSASSVTDEGATITWNANDMSAWQVQVSKGDAASWGESMAVATNSKVLTGLNANTLYYVRVRANCGDGEANKSEWSDNVSFTTLCGTVNVSATSSWNEDFQSFADNAVPDCWDNSASTTTSSWGAGYIWGTYSRLGNRMIRMDNAQLDGGTALINTPEIAIPNDGNTYELAFDYSNVALVGNNLSVKISANGGAFVEKGVYYPTGSAASYPGAFSNAVISLADYSGQTIKVQFFANPTSGTSSDGGAMFVDNISVHKVSSCAAPTALAAGNLTANNAHITWTAGASESAWRLQYRAEGGDWSAVQAVNTTPAFDIESLSANTLYYVRVKAYCDADDQSNWSDILSFTTLCDAASMPFSEEFSSASELPSCWEASTTSVNGWSAYEKSGAYAVQLRTGSSGEATLRMPTISLSEDAILRFEWKNANGANVNLYISTNGGATKTMIPNDLSSVYTDWTTKIFDLSAYTGQTALIYFVANYTAMNQYAYLDDVEVVARPCDMILNIQATPITGGATVSWNGNVKKLQYKTGSDAWSSVTISSGDYAGPKSISGLTPARTYQVRLLPACSEEEEGNWTTPIFFVTSSTESVPYYNDFEAETAGEVPFNWSRISSSDYPQISHDAYAYKEGGSFGDQGNSIKFYGVNEQIIVLPEFDATLSDLKIAFHYRNRDCTMQLGFVAADGTTFTAIETLPNQTGYGEYPYEKDLYGISSSASKLAIRYSATTASGQAWVDNVSVDNATCGQPTSLTVSDITATGAHISWAASARGTESNYQYIKRIWNESDPDWASAVLVESSVTELNLTGLSANTYYEFYLRSYCGVSDQSTPVKIEFKTGLANEVFEDVASATNNETRLTALLGQTLNITINRPLLRNGDYSTLCLPFDLSASQIADPECPLHGFVIKEFESSRNEAGGISIYLTQVTSIEAGKPYFVRYAGVLSDEQLSPLDFRNVTIKAAQPVEVEGDNCNLHGIFNPYNLTAGDESTLFLSSNNTLYWPSANGVMKGFRAYVKVPTESPLHSPIRRGAPIRIVEKENTATGIGEVQGNKLQSTKVIENGQLYIMYNGTKYNVQGQVVK